MTSIQESPDLLDHAHISRRFGYVYVATPKVGCSTIKATLQDAERGCRTEANGALDARTGYSKRLLRIHDRTRSPLGRPKNRWSFRLALYRSKLTFCFVRNPYTRVLSAYLDKIRSNEGRRSSFIASLGSASQDMSFVEFLELVALQKPAEMNEHWRSQVHHNMLDVVDYDFIGAFERFQEDLETVLRKAAPGALDFVSKADEHRTNAGQLIERYYADPAAGRLVRRIYAGDFELFGYPDAISQAGAAPRVNGFLTAAKRC